MFLLLVLKLCSTISIYFSLYPKCPPKSSHCVASFHFGTDLSADHELIVFVNLYHLNINLKFTIQSILEKCLTTCIKHAHDALIKASAQTQKIVGFVMKR